MAGHPLISISSSSKKGVAYPLHKSTELLYVAKHNSRDKKTSNLDLLIIKECGEYSYHNSV